MSAHDGLTVAGWRGISRFQYTVALLSGLVLFLDGFDTQAVNYAVPSIAREWQLAPTVLGPIFSSALVGLMVGYLALSPLADRFGHKRIVVVSTAAFGLTTLATVAAGSVWQLIALRFLTGVALGAAAPTVVALTDEFSPRDLRATFVLAIYCGFSLGFVAAGFAAAALLAGQGWRSLFWVGGLLPVLLCPILIAALPESAVFLARARRAGDNPAATPTIFAFLGEGRAVGTVLIWLVFVINLAAFYLLQSWLPTLLTGLHRDVETMAVATSLSTIGGIAAAFVVGPAMDRFGPPRPLAILYAIGAVAVALLGAALPAAAWKLYLATFCAGFCISGGQKSALALATLFYPTRVRSTGLGWALGIGRAGGIGGPLLAGVLLARDWSATALFYVVAGGTVVSALATAMLAIPSLTRQAESVAGPLDTPARS